MGCQRVRRVADELPKELLGAPALGDVDGDAVETLRLAMPVGDDVAPRVEPPDLSIGPHETMVEREGRSISDSPLHGVVHHVMVVGMDEAEDGFVRRLELARRDAEDPVELVGRCHDVSGNVPLPAPEMGEPLDLGELALEPVEASLRVGLSVV